jgi:putative ABC transport system permease protein
VRNFTAALSTILESWKRSVLSSVGVAIATVAISLLVSIGRGVEKDITRHVEDLGANVVVVVPGRVDLSMGFNPNLGGQSWFAEEDADRLRAVPGVIQVATLSFAGGGIRAGEREAYPFMVACTPEWFQMHRVQLESGRFFRQEAAHEVILGSVARESLFPADEPVGKSVEINGKTYQVVGVIRDQDASGPSLFRMQSFQNVGYIPFKTLKSDSKAAQIDRFMVQISHEAEPKALVSGLEAALGSRLDRQQFSVLTQEDLLGVVFQVVGIVSYLVIGLTSISLFVGCFGVMTVMLISVNERFKEIGVRKAVGATNQDIFWQFLFESALVSLVGVLIGLALSLAAAAALSVWTPIRPVMAPATVALATVAGVGVGCLFGVFPAVRAARQDPVVSLRNE